jgi:hypothetical protein
MWLCLGNLVRRINTSLPVYRLFQGKRIVKLEMAGSLNDFRLLRLDGLRALQGNFQHLVRRIMPLHPVKDTLT